MKTQAVVIGGSAGAFEALEVILATLTPDVAAPVLIAQHLHASDHGAFAQHLAKVTRMQVIEPDDKQAIEPGCVYTAPANYHMLVESDQTICLSVDERVNWSRPSIDVLFESAASVWRQALIAILLSGANADGVNGLRRIKERGGFVIAQSPLSAKTAVMPQAAIDAAVVDRVLEPALIARYLLARLCGTDQQP